jgi:NADP-dependent 3-hydroxy acid dehydrogenase YdfG
MLKPISESPHQLNRERHRRHNRNLGNLAGEFPTMTTKKKKLTVTEKPVWFITGCSTGFGRELAKYVLERGYRTVVTARHPEEVTDLAVTGEALVLKLDVTNQGQINAAIKAVEKTFGHIDVLVNNAGIGYFGAVEESEEKEVRRMFEINVFGLSRMIHAVLPGMRKRRKGFLVNFSSIGGLRSFPSVGYYNATKFAVEGLSEALWQEVEPLGIKVMLVEPSGFRTDWAGRSANESKRHIADYAATAGAWRKQVRAISGKQPGDPVRAAHAIVKAVESPKPPNHLLLGNDAYKGATAKLKALRREFSAWEAVSRGADFPKGKR